MAAMISSCSWATSFRLWARISRTPITIRAMARMLICRIGAPGIKAISWMKMPAISRTLGWDRNCFFTSSFRFPSEAARVTIMPVAVEIIRAGSWETRPSPTVAME